MKDHIHPSNTFHAYLMPIENGLRLETPTVYASSPEKLEAACDYYVSVTKPGMNTSARLDRVIAMRSLFGAQTTHSFN